MKFKTLLRKFPAPLSPKEWAAHRQGPKVLVNSCPKAGTHLLLGVIFNFPQIVSRWRKDIVDVRVDAEEIASLRRGQVLSGHFFWSEELVGALTASDVRPLFIIRDLRDVAVSRAFYHSSLTNHPAYPNFKQSRDKQEQLLLAIKGLDDPNKGFLSIRDWVAGYEPWLKEKRCLSLRFEDLVGAQGGGNNLVQCKTITAIAEYLGITLNEMQVENIASRTFNRNSNTFRKGCIGDWANHFNPLHKRVFKELAGDFLIRWGYAKNNDW